MPTASTGIRRNWKPRLPQDPPQRPEPRPEQLVPPEEPESSLEEQVEEPLADEKDLTCPLTRDEFRQYGPKVLDFKAAEVVGPIAGKKRFFRGGKGAFGWYVNCYVKVPMEIDGEIREIPVRISGNAFVRNSSLQKE